MPRQQAKKLKMVSWYDPSQLLKTAQQVFISTIFGRHSDYRILEALASGSGRIFDCIKDENDQPRDEIWIDYVADTGDGWNSTYTIAYYLAQPQLAVQDSNKTKHSTKRGNILIFGGDQVYPTPSRKEYEQRLVEAYKTALMKTDPPHPQVFAIPGNHDWYDSLVSFTRLFCSKEWFAGWRAPQSRSYFALKLPHSWWLLGTDVQLGSDIDRPQVEYFQEAVKQMQNEDRVVICTAEPHWIYEKVYGKYDPVYSENNLKFLEEKVLGRKATVFIAGDLHHYRRHEAKDRRQKIIAGGGGAFLHPTHGQDVSELAGGYTLKSSFPNPATSRKLCWRNLYFPLLNKNFGLLPGIFYVLTAWSVMADIGHMGIRDIGLAITTTLRTTLSSPVTVFWAVALFFGFLIFTDTHSKWYRRVMGSVHGLTHLTAVFFLGWGAAYLSVTVFGLEFKSISQLILSGIIIFGGGWFIGSFIMGIYLFVSLNVFGRHSNEAFSSLAIPDWKNFLRLRIDANGNLTIFPIGICRIVCKWKSHAANTTGPEFVPDDPKATVPGLIESPIVLDRSTTVYK